MFRIFLLITLIAQIFFVNLALAVDIEDLERELEKKELENEIGNKDIIDEIELKKELESLNKETPKVKKCKPIIKTIYKTVPTSCKDVENYYITRKYSLYDVIMFNKDNLQLTYEQVRRINEIHTKLTDKILSRKAQINILNKKVKTFIKMKNINAIRSSLIQIARLKLEISYLDIIEYIKTMEILTERQRKLLEKLIEW